MKPVLIEEKDDITVVTLNQTQVRNAVDGNTADALLEAFIQFDQNPNQKVAILTGAGEHFCAGANLKAIAGDGTPNRLDPQGAGPMGPTRLALTKPVIAAIEGYCVAGGLELACWCDLRVAGKNAVFGVFCRRFGVPLIDGGTVRLPRLIGMSRAMDMILTGRAVDAEEALSFGLVNRISAPGKALETALQLARTLGDFPQTCLRHDRLSAYRQWQLDEPDALAEEFRLGMATIRSGETQAGAMDFSDGKNRSDDKGRHGHKD